MSNDRDTPQGKRARQLLYRRATAAAMLNTSISQMKRFEREGLLTKKRLGSRDVYYPAEEVHRLAADD